METTRKAAISGKGQLARNAEEPLIPKAGADCVREPSFGSNELKAAVSRRLKLPAPSQPPLEYRSRESLPVEQALGQAGVGHFPSISPEVLRS